MKRGITIIMVVFLGFTTMTNAAIVELDLFDLGCPRQYDHDNSTPDPSYWKSDFDLGVTLTEITNVYMDWAGEITAGLAIYDYDPGNPFPLEVGIYASLGFNPSLRRTEVWGGETTYPEPEGFSYLSKIGPSGTVAWSDLLDGEGVITIGYTEFIILFGRYVQHGSILLDKATLSVEGTIIPEPSTFLFFAVGLIVLRRKH